MYFSKYLMLFMICFNSLKANTNNVMIKNLYLVNNNITTKNKYRYKLNAIYVNIDKK